MFTWDVFIHPTKYHDMSFLEIHNVKIKGISACVPSRVEETKDYSLMTEEEIQKYISSTGVIRKHRVKETAKDKMIQSIRTLSIRFVLRTP